LSGGVEGSEASECVVMVEDGGCAVDGFGGEGDELAAVEEFGGVADVGVVIAGLEDLDGLRCH